MGTLLSFLESRLDLDRSYTGQLATDGLEFKRHMISQGVEDFVRQADRLSTRMGMLYLPFEG